MTDLFDGDLSGIIDRAVGRWLRTSMNISVRSLEYGQEFRSAAMNHAYPVDNQRHKG